MMVAHTTHQTANLLRGGGTGTSSWACGAFFPLVIQLAVFGAWLMPTGSVRSLPHLLSTFAGR